MPDARHTTMIVLAAGILSTLGSACYDASGYSGDGSVIDYGYRSHYPRFVIEFPELNVAAAGTQRYSFRGAPSSEFVFNLRVLSSEPDNSFADSEWTVMWQSLKVIGSDVSVTLRSSAGGIVCEASGQLAGGWVPAGTGVAGKAEMTRYFWHHDCTNVRLAPGESYDLTIRVKVDDSSSEGVFALPTLEGGGWDS